MEAAHLGLPTPAGYATPPAHPAARPDLVQAVLATLAYADVFGHPLAADEVHRFLVASRATFEEVDATLRGAPELRRLVEHKGGWFTVAGRAGNVALRQRREEAALRVWPKARRWGRVLAALPFVRLVAVTGALAVDAVDPGADIDYLIVASVGRVWSCRAIVTALARAARLAGASLCPNYVLSEAALAVPGRTLYTAHELLQMVPLAGRESWRQLCEGNAWVFDFLPNARWATPPRGVRPVGGVAARLAERLLGTGLGDRFEAMLQRRQVAHLTRKIAQGRLPGGEAAFGPDGYKGHFDAHGTRILAAWRTGLDRLTGWPA